MIVDQTSGHVYSMNPLQVVGKWMVVRKKTVLSRTGWLFTLKDDPEESKWTVQ